MATTTSQLKVVISARDEASKTISGTSKAFNGLKNVAVGAMKAVGVAAVAGLTAAATIGIKTAATVEQQTVAFTTLLGSTEAANKALNRIKDDAKKTPFELPGLTQANQLLISAGLEADRAADFVLAVGNAISATGGGDEELQRLSVNLQQIKNLGHATAIDLKQFAFAGIDIYGLLAESMGKSREEIGKMEASAFTFDILEKAFSDASKEGGRFFGAMEDQSTTFNGIISNIKDTFSLTMSDMMKDSGAFGFIKDLLDQLLGSIEKAPAMIKTMQDKVKELINILEEMGIIDMFRKAIAELSNTIQTELLPFIQDNKDELILLAKVIGGILIGAVYGLIKGVDVLIKVIVKVMRFFEAFRDLSVKVLTKLKDAFFGSLNFVMQLWDKTANYINNKIEQIKEYIRPIVNFISIIFNAVKDTIREVWNIIYNNIIKPKIDDWKNAIGTIRQWVEAVFIWVRDKVRFLMGKITEVVSPQIEKIKGFFSSIKEWVSDRWNAIVDTIRGKVNEAQGVVSGPIDAIKNKFGEIWGKVRDTFADIARDVVGWVANIANRIPILKIPFEAGQSVAGGEGYAKGTTSVPGDGMYMLHRGEQVIPAGVNTAGGGEVNININNPTVRNNNDLREIVKAVQDALDRDLKLEQIGIN